MKKSNYSRFFLIITLAALCLCAVGGIVFFIFGDITELAVPLALTALTIVGYSLTGLCSSSIYHREGLKFFSLLGMLAAIWGCIGANLFIWDLVWIDSLLKTVIGLTVVSIGSAHAALLLRISVETERIKLLRTFTVSFLVVICLMSIYSVMVESVQSDFYHRTLGVLAILVLLGTVLVPSLNSTIKAEQ